MVHFTLGVTGAPPAGEPSPNRGAMIVLAYLWFLALVPLLVEKDDREVQWHAKHGIVLMVAELILGVALVTLAAVVGLVALGLGFVVSIFAMLAWIAVFMLHIVAIV